VDWSIIKSLRIKRAFVVAGQLQAYNWPMKTSLSRLFNYTKKSNQCTGDQNPNGIHTIIICTVYSCMYIECTDASLSIQSKGEWTFFGDARRPFARWESLTKPCEAKYRGFRTLLPACVRACVGRVRRVCVLGIYHREYSRCLFGSLRDLLHCLRISCNPIGENLRTQLIISARTQMSAEPFSSA